MERQRFEDSWKESFKDSEVSPSESLWTNIELDLEKAEGKVMKRRVLFFKLLAAASVAFAMTFAGVGIYFMTRENSGALATVNSSEGKSNQSVNGISSENQKSKSVLDNNKDKLDNADENSVSASTAAEIKESVDSKNTSDKNLAEKSSETSRESTVTGKQESAGESSNKERQTVASNSNSSVANSNPTKRKLSESTGLAKGSETNTKNDLIKPGDPVVGNINSIALIGNNSSENSQGEVLRVSGSLPTLTRLSNPGLPVNTAEADPVAVMMAKLKAKEELYAKSDSKADKKEKMKSTENVWTSVGVSAGSFNTVTTGNTTLATQNNMTGFNNMQANNVVKNQSKAAGRAYTMGVSVGGKVSERWVLQGGVNYQTQSSDYTSNAVVGSADYATFKAASITELNNAGKTDSRLLTTSTYNVNASLQYISVPLQAGYLIINRGFGVQLNAGVSTDLFIQSTLTPDEGSLEKSTQGNTAESPYRTVNFSGLVGTELSYRFGKRYRLALNPGLRYPFSSIYKSELNVNANPLTFDVGLRFRYIFN